MRILVLGGDGYLGWPMVMYLAVRNHELAVLDSAIKRSWEKEVGGEPLVSPPALEQRAEIFRKHSARQLKLFHGSLLDPNFVYSAVGEFEPEVVLHFAEQPSAPYSMMDRERALSTQQNNVLGTLNLLFALRDLAPKAHLVKLGTMGEYGTPNIDIEEGFIEISHKGRKDRLPFPKQPGSFYHLSKVHDSHNIQFACGVWGLRATDLNQGVVYGIETEETKLHPDLQTSFHYDAIFGTSLNRFCVQAVIGEPLTVYGKGGQRRGFLNIRDTLRCVEIAIQNAPEIGTYRVFNQFTEVFSVRELAEMVKETATHHGITARVESIPNPRVEMEEHYYNPVHRGLKELGWKPVFLSDELINSMLRILGNHRDLIRADRLLPRVGWKKTPVRSAKAVRVLTSPSQATFIGTRNEAEPS